MSVVTSCQNDNEMEVSCIYNQNNHLARTVGLSGISDYDSVQFMANNWVRSPFCLMGLSAKQL